MNLLSGAFLLPFIGALLHPFLSWCVQSASRAGARPTLITCLSSLTMVIVFLAYLRPNQSWTISGSDWWAILCGFLFFAGQWFSVQSVKSGDIAVHSSALGIKLIIVAALSLFFGLEVGSWTLLGGVILAVLSVFLVTGGTLSGWKTHRATVGFTIVACLFFGFTDFMTSWKGPVVQPERWLVLLVCSNGLLSSLLLLTRVPQLRELMRQPKVRGLVFSAGFIFGVQALVVNIALSHYEQPTLSNVVYSSRGVIAVLFMWWIYRSRGAKLQQSQITGALLMMIALILIML